VASARELDGAKATAAGMANAGLPVLGWPEQVVGEIEWSPMRLGAS
jgi:hypothetical protein